jgi:hypothetical protein
MILDGPVFGTEQWFNQLRVVQMIMMLGMLASLMFKQKAVQVTMAAINLTALMGAAIVRFFPGAYA